MVTLAPAINTSAYTTEYLLANKRTFAFILHAAIRAYQDKALNYCCINGTLLLFVKVGQGSVGFPAQNCGQTASSEHLVRCSHP